MPLVVLGCFAVGGQHFGWVLQNLHRSHHMSVMQLTRLLPPRFLQHGQGLGDRFSVDYIFMDAQKAVNGTPATGVDEVVWLRAFLQARKALLASWDATSAVSTPRITIYQKLVDIGEHMGRGVLYSLQPNRQATLSRHATALQTAPGCALLGCPRCRQSQPGWPHVPGP